MEYRENRWKGGGKRRKEEEKSRKRNRVYRGKIKIRRREENEIKEGKE